MSDLEILNDCRPWRAMMFGSAVQVDENRCPWRGENDCRPWRAMMFGIAFCVGIDLSTGVVATFAGKAMETSKRAAFRRCAQPETQVIYI